MTIKDFDTKKVILEDQYKSDLVRDDDSLLYRAKRMAREASILMLFTPKSVLSIR